MLFRRRIDVEIARLADWLHEPIFIDFDELYEQGSATSGTSLIQRPTVDIDSGTKLISGSCI